MLLSPSFMASKVFALLSKPVSILRKYIQSPPETQSSSVLEVIDHRTGRRYRIPISDNAIEARHIRRINESYSSNRKEWYASGLKVLDPGFENTAVTKSRVTFV